MAHTNSSGDWTADLPRALEDWGSCSNAYAGSTSFCHLSKTHLDRIGARKNHQFGTPSTSCRHGSSFVSPPCSRSHPPFASRAARRCALPRHSHLRSMFAQRFGCCSPQTPCNSKPHARQGKVMESGMSACLAVARVVVLPRARARLLRRNGEPAAEAPHRWSRLWAEEGSEESFHFEEEEEGRH